jgi:hypothetical protein
MKQFVLATMLGLAVAISMAGCGKQLERVQPWEREQLAGDLMRPDLDSAESQDWEHIYFSKEATPGRSGGGGGGCGCN